MNDPNEREDDEASINPDDVVEVIELDENQPVEEALAYEVDDVNLAEDGAEGDDEDDMEGVAEGVEVRDDADMVFSKHKGSVFCIDTDPQTCTMAVTGGEDDKAFVWKLGSGEDVLECSGHKDSVVCAAFNRNSKYIATGDMSGLIKVWELAKKEEIWSFECSDLEWMCWHESTDILLVGTVDGDVWMWMIPGGMCKTYQGPGYATSCGKVMPDGKQVCAGYEDGSVRIWDLKAGTPSYTLTGGETFGGGVTCVDCHKDNVLVLGGSSDVTAKLINVHAKKVLCTFNCSSNSLSREDDSVEAVGFSPTNSFAATGTLAGRLTIWDIPSQGKRLECRNEAGVVRLRWDPSAPVVYTCTLDGVCQLWDARSGKKEAEWSGHQGEILDFDFTRDGNTMVTSSGDGTARVFNLSSADR